MYIKDKNESRVYAIAGPFHEDDALELICVAEDGDHIQSFLCFLPGTSEHDFELILLFIFFLFCHSFFKSHHIICESRSKSIGLAYAHNTRRQSTASITLVLKSDADWWVVRGQSTSGIRHIVLFFQLRHHLHHGSVPTAAMGAERAAHSTSDSHSFQLDSDVSGQPRTTIVYAQITFPAHRHVP